VAQKMHEFFCRIQGIQPDEVPNGEEEVACSPA